jgi:hypothetical protein|tara:strand:- start:616 stop:831 length:216 start_codon:yes stop_codon:yes gene_type:complete
MSEIMYNININRITGSDNLEEMDILYCNGTLGIKYDDKIDTLTEINISLDKLQLLKSFFAHVYECELEQRQ